MRSLPNTFDEFIAELKSVNSNAAREGMLHKLPEELGCLDTKYPYAKVVAWLANQVLLDFESGDITMAGSLEVQEIRLKALTVLLDILSPLSKAFLPGDYLAGEWRRGMYIPYYRLSLRPTSPHLHNFLQLLESEKDWEVVAELLANPRLYRQYLVGAWANKKTAQHQQEVLYGVVIFILQMWGGRSLTNISTQRNISMLLEGKTGNVLRIAAAAQKTILIAEIVVKARYLVASGELGILISHFAKCHQVGSSWGALNPNDLLDPGIALLLKIKSEAE